MSKSAKTKANTKANTTITALATASASTSKPKKSVKINEDIDERTVSRVSTPDKKAVFSSKQEAKDRKNEYYHGADSPYLRGKELKLNNMSRRVLMKVKAPNAIKDETRKSNMEFIDYSVNKTKDYLKYYPALSLIGTRHDNPQFPIADYYSKKNLDRIDNKKKRGGKKRTRKNRTQRKH
jgi:hypothetical protein